MSQPWKIQGQAQWDSEQPGLVDGVPGHGREARTTSLKSLQIQTIL